MGCHGRVNRGYDAGMNELTSLLEFVAPASHEPLVRRGGALVGARPGRVYPVRADWIDFLPDEQPPGGNVLHALMHLPVMSSAYEQLRRAPLEGAAASARARRRANAMWAAEQLAAVGGVVADVACGTGEVGVASARRGGVARVLCIDRAEPMLAHCVRRLERGGPRSPVTLVRADARQLPLRAAALDAAHVHIGPAMWRHGSAIFKELSRVIRPHGRLFVTGAPRARVLDGRRPRMVLEWTAGLSAPTPERIIESLAALDFEVPGERTVVVDDRVRLELVKR